MKIFDDVPLSIFSAMLLFAMAPGAGHAQEEPQPEGSVADKEKEEGKQGEAESKSEKEAAAKKNKNDGKHAKKTAEEPYKTEIYGKRVLQSSATWTDTPWIEVPQSVQTVDAAALKVWGVETANESWKLTSGFQPQDQNLQSRGGGLAKSRGVQGTQTLLNGFTMPQRMSLYYDLISIGSIDFFKGPADALDGTQTPSGTLGGFGGQVNLNSLSPLPVPMISAGLSGRSIGDERLKLTLGWNEPIGGSLIARVDAAGQLGLRFYVPWDFADSPEMSYAVAPVLLWKPHEMLTLKLRGSWQQNRGYSYKGVPVIYGNLLGDYKGYLGNKDSVYRYAGAMAQIEADLDVNDYFSTHASFSYMHTRLDYALWAWGTSRTFSFNDMVETGTGLPSFSTTKSTGYALGTRVYAVARGAVGWWKSTGLVGFDVEYMHSMSDSSPWTVPDTPISIEDPVLPEPQASTGTSTTGPSAGGRMKYGTLRYGLLAQYQAGLSRYVRLLIGGRVDHHGYDLESSDTAYDKIDLSWRTGLTILPLKVLALYGNYTSARSPNFGLLDADGNAITESQLFQQAEVGIKAEPLEGLILSVAGFSIWNDKVPVALPTEPGSTDMRYELSGKGSYLGYEIAAQGSLTSCLDLMASYSYLDLDTDQVGSYHNLAPHMLSIWAMGHLAGPLRHLSLGAGYRYTAERQVGYGTTVDQRNILPAYHILDLCAEYSLPARLLAAKSWVVRLNFDNVTNTRYYVTARQVSEVTAGEPFAMMLTMAMGW